MARAKAAEAKRDLQNQKNEGFEIASAILQVGIVVASATIITGSPGSPMRRADSASSRSG